MDQLTLFERLQKIIDAYEQTMTKRFDQLQAEILLLLDEQYMKYGESISGYTKYSRLLALKKQLDQTVTAHYTQLAKELQQATEEVYKESYLLYAYLIYMYLGEEDGKLLPLTTTIAKTEPAIELVLLLLKVVRKPLTYFNDGQVDLVDVLDNHKNNCVYGIFNDVKTNLRGEDGFIDVSAKVKKRTQSTKGFGVRYLYELLNDVINYVQDKVYDVAKDKTDVTKLWISMRDTSVREEHRILDSQLADEQGYFHFAGDKAKRPKLWRDPKMNWGCRCKIFLSFGGKLPRISRVRDYRDGKYITNLHKRIEELQERGKTYIQALQQAQKDVHAPKRWLESYITYDDWLEEYGPLNGE